MWALPLRLQVKGAVPGAVRQALPGVLVEQAAGLSLPPFLAHAGPVDAESMSGARGVGAVH